MLVKKRLLWTYLIWLFLGENLKKTIVTLDLSTFNFSKCNISCKQNIFKYRTEIASFGYFFGRNSKRLLCCGILHHHLQIFPNVKLLPKMKILKFRTKTALICYFRPEFQKAKVVFTISILEFVNMQIFIQKQKNL